MGVIVNLTCQCMKDESFFIGYGMLDFDKKVARRIVYCEKCEKFSTTYEDLTCECGNTRQVVFNDEYEKNVICPRCKGIINMSQKGLWD